GAAARRRRSHVLRSRRSVRRARRSGVSVAEWDKRLLCPDGGCVGLIGPDGTCKVCGRAAPNWGDERTRGLIEPTEVDDEDEDEDDEDDEVDEAPARVAVSNGPWSDRRLCPDGSCIGLIGDDGRCK